MGLIQLNDLFVEQLHCLYDAEKQLIIGLPKIIARITSAKLRGAIEAHLVETHIHLQRLELVCAEFRVRSAGRPCKGMNGILKEPEDFLTAKSTRAVLDAAIIAVCDRIESYEVASYASALAISELLGSEIASRYLHQTLAEERVASRMLVNIAIGSVNEAADNSDRAPALR